MGDKIRSKYDEELKDISAKVTQTSIDTKKKKQTEIASEIVMGVILAVLRKRNLVQYADYLQENVFNDLQDLYKVKRTNAEQFAQIRQDDTMKEKVAALEYFISEVKTLIAQMKNEVLKQAQLDQKRQARVSLSKDEGSTVVVLTAILTTVIGISLFFKPLLYLGAGFGIVAFLTGVISRLIPGAAPEIDKREGRLLQMPISRRAALQTLSSIIGFVTLGGITGIVTGCSSFRKGADTSLLSRVTDVVYDETIPTVDDLMKQPRVYDPGLYTIGQFKKGRPTVITVMGATPTHRHYINYKTMLKSFENNYNTVVFLYDFTKPIKENGYYLRTSFKKFIDINQPEHITFVPHSYGTNVLMQAVLDLEAGEENIFRNTDIIQLTPVFMGSRKATNASRGYKRAFLELIAKLGFPDYTLSTEAADPEREIVADLCNNYDLFDKRVGTINVIAVKNDSHAPNKTSSPQFKQRYKEFVEDKLDKDGFLESKGGDGHLEVLWIPKALSMIMKLVDPQRKKPAPIEKEKARKTVTLLETDEVAHAEGMMLESPAAISKNGINAIEEIKKQVQSHSQQIRINGKVVHVDNDLLAHYKQLTFKTEEEFLDFLKKFLISEFSTYPPENNEITLAVLDEAESLFEDHQPNGFIGIHRSLFEKLHTSPKTALALLMVGLRHELSHEAMYMERVVLVDHFQKVQNMTFSKATQAAETFITDNRGTLKQALKNNGLWDTVEEKMLERDLDHAEGVALDIEQVIASDILPASAPFVKRYQEEGRFAYRTILEDELETLDVKYGLIDKENHIFKDIQTIFSKIITAAGVSEENITLHLVNSDEINAWWLTDSRSFFLSVGLIKTLHQYLKENNKIMTQDMVAFILGHELRHMVQYLEGKDVIVEEESKNKKQMRKNKEYDADLYGMRYAAAAGYNPGASVDVLAFLGEITGATYISGHPDARDRVGEVKKILTSPDEFIPNVKKGAHYFSDTFINEPLINVPTVVEEFHETMLAAESLDEVGESIQEVDSLDRMEEALMYYYFRFLYDLSSGVIKDPNFQKYMSYILTADNIMTVIEERFDMAGAHSYYFDWKIPITLSKLFHYYTLQGPGQEHGSLSLLGKEAGVSRDKVIQSIYTKISERLKSLRYVSDDEREKKRQRYEIMKASVDGILHESDHKELMRVIAHTEALGIEYRKQVTLPSRNLLETFSFPILSTRNLRDGSVIVEYFDTQALVNNFESWWSYFEHYDRERYEQRSRTKKVYQDSQIFGVKEWQQKKYGKVELPALLFDILPDYGFDEELKEEIENGRSQFLPLYLRFLAFHFMVQKQGPFAAATVQNHPPLIHKRMIEEKTQSLLTKQYPSLNNPVITLLSKLKYFSLLRSFDAAYDTDIQQIIAELSPDDINTVFQILTNEPSYYLSSIPAPLAKMIDFESYLKQVQKQFIPYYCSIVADIFRMQSRNIIINQNHLTMIMTLLRTFNVRYPGSLTNNPGVQKLLGTVIEVLAKERDEKILNMILMTVADTKDDDIKETLLSYLFTSYFPQQDVEEKIDCLLRMYPFSSNVQNKRLESLFDTIDYAGMSDSSKEQFLERFLPLFKTDKSMLSHTPVSRGEKGLHQKLSRDYMQVLKDKGISFVELVQKMDAANAVVTRFDFIVDNKAMWEGSSYEELHQIVAVITNSSAGYATYQNLIGTLFLTKIKADIPTFVKPSTRGNYNIYKETMGDDVFPRYLSAYIRKGKDIKNWLFEGMSFDESMSLVLYALPRSSERDSRLRDIIASFNPSNEEMLRFSDSFVALENTRELLSLNVQHGSGFSTGGPALRDEAILHLIGLNKIGGDNVPTPSDIQHRITILNTVVPEKVKENIDIEAELSSLEASLTETAKKLEKVLETNPLSVDRYGCATSFNDALIRFVTRFVVPESEHFDYFNLRDFRYQQNEYFLKFLPLYQNEADFFQKVDVSFADKVAKLLRYFPAKTTFRDNEIEKLLVQYEARIFGISNPLVYQKSNLRGAAYESYDVIRRQRLDIKKITREDADFLINHYKDALLLMTDGTHQIMLGRKIYALEMHFHPDIFSDFKRGFSEILILFPKFSDTRDSVLNEFINMAAVRSAAHLREIDNYILAQQRLTREADVVKDTYTDELWKAISQLSTRREKADFILWVLDMNRPVAESIRGPSSYNNVNFTSLPAIIFGLTQGEREKLFYELLSRRNGLFEIDDTSEPEEYAQFERFIDELFSIVFPDDELGEGQAVMHDIFKTIFKQYSTERRIMLFNALFDLFSDPDVGRRQRGVKVRLFLEQLGVVGVKVGQYLSEQATLFDGAEDIREELKKLKTDATGFHKRAIFQFLYESGLLEGIQIGDDFIKVDYLLDRLGVASIKQVYEVLLSDGRKVTGKFMRPAAEKFLDEDLSVLKKVLTMLEVDYERRYAVPSSMLDDITTIVFDELKFEQEAKNAERHRKNIQRRMPRVAEPFTINTPKVVFQSQYIIIEQNVNGITLADLFLLKKKEKEGIDVLTEEDRKRVTEIEKRFPDDLETFLAMSIVDIKKAVMSEFFEQVYKEGFFHGDLHFGNVMVTPTKELYIIDWGAAGEVQNEDKRSLLLLLVSLEGKQFTLFRWMINRFLDSKIQTDKEANRQLKQIVKSQETLDNKLKNITRLIGEKNLNTRNNFIMYLKALSAVAPIFDTETDPDLTNDEKRTLDKELQRMTRKALFSRQTKKVPESPTATLQGSGKLFSVNLGLASLFGAEGIIDQANLLISQSMLEGPEVFTPIVLGIIVFIIAARWIIRNLDQLSTSFAKMFLFITELFRGQDEQLQEIDSSQTDVDATRKSISIYATLPETYELFGLSGEEEDRGQMTDDREKIDEMRRSVAVNYAPWIEEWGVLGIVALLIWKRLLRLFRKENDAIERLKWSNIGWKEKVKITAVSRIPVTVFTILHVLFSHSGYNIFTALGVILVGGLSAHYFGQFHERDKKSYIQAALIFTMPFFTTTIIAPFITLPLGVVILSFPVMLVVSTLVHRWWNYTVPKWSQDNTKRQFEALTAIPANQYIGMKLKEVLEKEYIETGTIVFFNYEGNNTGLVEMLRSKEQKGEIHDSDVIVIKFVKTNIDGKNISVFGDTLANIKKELTDERIGTKDMWQKFIFNILSRIDNEGKLHWEALYVQESLRDKKLGSDLSAQFLSVLSKTVPGIAIYGNAINIITAECFADRFNGRFDTYRDDLTPNDRYLRLARMMGFITEDEMRTEKGWVRFLVERINTVKNQRGFNTLTDLQYYLREFDTLAQRSAILFRISNSLIGDSGTPKDEFKGIVDVLTERYGTQWYYAPSKEQFDEITTLLKQYNIFKDVDSMTAYKPEDEYSKNVIKKILFNDKNVGVLAVGTVPTYAELKTTQEEKMKQRKIAESKAINPIEQKDMEKDLTFSEDKPYHFEVDPELVSNSMSQLEGLGLSELDVGGALSTIKSDLPLAYGFHSEFYEGLTTQMPLIKQDFVRYVREKENTGDRSVTMYDIGLGRSPQEAMQIIKAFNEAIEEVIDEEKRKLWTLEFIGIDATEEYLIMADDIFKAMNEGRHTETFFDPYYDAGVQYFEKPLSIKLNMQLIQAHTLDASRLAMLGNAAKGDYVFCRHVTYANHRTASGRLNRQSMAGYLSDILNIFLSTKNIIQLLCKESTRFIIEPIDKARVMRADNERDVPVFHIPGVELFTYNTFLPDQRIAEESLDNRGTGIYRITDPHKIGEYTLEGFLEELDRQNKIRDDIETARERPFEPIDFKVISQAINVKKARQDITGAQKQLGQVERVVLIVPEERFAPDEFISMDEAAQRFPEIHNFASGKMIEVLTVQQLNKDKDTIADEIRKKRTILFFIGEEGKEQDVNSVEKELIDSIKTKVWLPTDRDKRTIIIGGCFDCVINALLAAEELGQDVVSLEGVGAVFSNVQKFIDTHKGILAGIKQAMKMRMVKVAA
ncbi:MAG: M48 family metalloprotease [Candidatus Omnitrophica bacterium]|nr:M48 family metalloprotease [Candidatus Omnitrophota bacterium]